MVEEDRYCIDVITQISAIEAALEKVALGLLDGHTRHCVLGPESDARGAYGRAGGSLRAASRSQQPFGG